jgi:hypothetical protein
VRYDDDFTDRRIRRRFADPAGKHCGLVSMPAGDAAHKGVPDQNTGSTVEVMNPIIPRGELAQCLDAVRNRKTGLELMISVDEDHAVECVAGSEHLHPGAFQRA